MDAVTAEPKIYRIPDVNYSAFEQRFNRLQRRATKLNSGSISMQQVGHEDWPAYHYLDAEAGRDRITFMKPGSTPSLDLYTPLNYFRRYYMVQVSGEAPKLNGWEFIGSLELIFDEAGNTLGQMVRTIPDKEMPVEYRDAKVWCDHCKANRRWHSTFVVRHEDGTHKQVGRNCLRDFTGHLTPESIANMAEILLSAADLGDCAEDDDWGFGGGSGTRYYDVETLLVNTSSIVRRDGWKPKSFEHQATSATLTAMVNAYKSDEIKWFEKNYPVEDIDRTTAEQALEFMLSLAEKPNASDYEYNLSLLARAGKVPSKSFGFVASAIPAYMRAHDREVTRKNETANSDYVGAVKERMEMTLTLARVNYFDTQFGSMGLHKFVDESGNVIIWKTGSDPQIAVGDKIRVKATVSEHKVYRDCKQTEVKRLTVLETLSAPKQETVAA